ncbi:MAG: hypothetical protein K6E91_12840 [Butyrivibrio sp.]|nr:hypothetical protein [Butyrivibrio sp.]
MSNVFKIGDVTISAMASNHPGESTVIGLEYKGKKLVYATDFEHMAKDADAEVKLQHWRAKETGTYYEKFFNIFSTASHPNAVFTERRMLEDGSGI